MIILLIFQMTLLLVAMQSNFLSFLWDNMILFVLKIALNAMLVMQSKRNWHIADVIREKIRDTLKTA